jgi:hypothetical protein
MFVHVCIHFHMAATSESIPACVQEVDALKEELFRCVFEGYVNLQRGNAPRTSETFRNARPYFELYEK